MLYIFGGISSLLIIENLQSSHIPSGLSVSLHSQILQIIDYSILIYSFDIKKRPLIYFKFFSLWEIVFYRGAFVYWKKELKSRLV